MSKEYYTVKELAELFEVNTELVHRWIREGRLKAEWCDCVSRNAIQEFGGYIVYTAELEKFDPIKGKHSLDMLMSQQKRIENQRYLDYLDKRYEDLYSELELIDQTRSYLRKIKPYL